MSELYRSSDRILGFLEGSRYFFFEAAPQLYWVDPIPDPLLLRKSVEPGTFESVARNCDRYTTEADTWYLTAPSNRGDTLNVQMYKAVKSVDEGFKDWSRLLHLLDCELEFYMTGLKSNGSIATQLNVVTLTHLLFDTTWWWSFKTETCNVV
jgi:hypothetical protein